MTDAHHSTSHDAQLGIDFAGLRAEFGSARRQLLSSRPSLSSDQTSWATSRPMPTSTQMPRIPESSSGEARSFTQAMETVLLVEDEAVIRSLVSRILRAQGYKVLEATSGNEALEIAQRYQEGPIHLVLTDMVMPQMGGQSLVGYLTRWFPEICVVYMSGYASSDLINRQVVGESAAFIQKPFAPADLTRKLRAVLDRAAAGD